MFNFIKCKMNALELFKNCPYITEVEYNPSYYEWAKLDTFGDYSILYYGKDRIEVRVFNGKEDDSYYYNVNDWDKFIEYIESNRTLEGIKIPRKFLLLNFGNNEYSFAFNDLRKLGFRVEKGNPSKLEKVINLVNELLESGVDFYSYH